MAKKAYRESPIHEWFELSYSSWCTLPRVLMEQMPYEWQKQMKKLLEEYEERYTGYWEEIDGTRVQTTKDNKLVKTPSWLLNYKHPEMEEIKKYFRTEG